MKRSRTRLVAISLLRRGAGIGLLSNFSGNLLVNLFFFFIPSRRGEAFALSRSLFGHASGEAFVHRHGILSSESNNIKNKKVFCFGIVFFLKKGWINCIATWTWILVMAGGGEPRGCQLQQSNLESVHVCCSPQLRDAHLSPLFLPFSV